MEHHIDFVARYAASHGLRIAPRTLLVEGTSDEELLRRAAALQPRGAAPLIGHDFTVVAAGVRDRGGANGVVRELIALRQLSRTALDQSGNPKYRFAALFDNDVAGNAALRTACSIDTSIVENRDVFRLRPSMPVIAMTEPGAVGRALQKANAPYSILKWEIEDAFEPDFVEAFVEDNASALIKRQDVAGKTHWEFTDDGKARFHRFVHAHANSEDLNGIRAVLLAMRCYMNA
jgi:hypothetical protein